VSGSWRTILVGWAAETWAGENLGDLPYVQRDWADMKQLQDMTEEELLRLAEGSSQGTIIQDALIFLCGERPITYQVIEDGEVVDSFHSVMDAHRFVIKKLKGLRKIDPNHPEMKWTVMPKKHWEES
jgi:hypothetical protein